MPDLRSKDLKQKDDSLTEETTTKLSNIELTQWVMFGPEKLFSSDENDSLLGKLPHPQNGVESLFMFQNDKVYELMKFKEPFRSWFIGESVQKDGSLHIFTPIDPLFLALPFLQKPAASNRFTTLDNILTDENYSSVLQKLETCLTKQNLINICQSKGDDDYTAYKMDEEKVIQWLTRKVRKMASHLKDTNINVCAGAQLSSFNRASIGNKNEDDCLKYAWSIVSDYITQQYSEKLKNQLSIKEPIKEEVPEPPNKKQKLENNNGGCLEDYRNTVKSEKKTTKKLTTKQKSLLKVDKKGMKSMTSFFTKKSKQ